MTQIENQAEQIEDLEQDEQTGQKKQFRRRLPPAREVAYSLWKAVRAAESLLDSEESGVRLKAVHATSTAAGAYLKALELTDLESRLTALERSLKIKGETV